MDNIINNQISEQKHEPVPEKVVEFKLISDRSVLHVISPKSQKVMVEISGYDLDINFNMEYLKSMEDIDAACEGLSQLFREIIVEKLLEYKHNEE